ncbi:MAG: hypothetical protein ACLQVN_26040 [Bryobacteraceae bacterium]
MKGSRKRGAERKDTRPQLKIPKPAPDQHHWLAMAALCAVTLLAYANSFGSGFVLDNRGILLQDPRIQTATAENLRLIFQHTYWWPYGESGLYRPLTTLTYLFNYAILGNADHPAGYHWINILLHAGNVLLVYFLALRLVREFWPSVFLAALWAVHPVLTESVTNIVGRADLLAGTALLGGLWMYLRSAESGGWRRWAWLAGLFALTTAGVFFKESAAAVLGAIVLFELTWWRERKRGAALLLGCVAVLLAFEVMWYARGAVFSQLPPTQFPYWDNPLVDAGFWTARLTAIKVLAKYLGLLVWPAHPSCDYSYAQIPVANGSLQDWLGWLTVAAAAAGTAWLYRRNRALFFFVGLAFLTLLPTANLLFPIGTIMAERFLYLPAIALAACVVLGAYALARRAGRPAAAPVALCLIGAAFTVRTWARNEDWRDDLTLMTAAVDTSPDSYKTHKLLAGALYESDPTHANIDRVIAEAERSLAILSPVADWHNNPDSYRRAGEYYRTKGDLLSAHDPDGQPAVSPDARQAYRRSLELLRRVRSIVRASLEHEVSQARSRGRLVPQQDDAKVADVERSISAVELRLGEYPGVIEAARNAERLDPAAAASYHQLSSALLAAGRADEAAVALVEGSVVTGDVTLRQELLRLYQTGLDTKGCATVPGPYGPAINPKCEMVRRHACEGSAAAFEVFIRLGRQDLVQKTKAEMAGIFDCR